MLFKGLILCSVLITGIACNGAPSMSFVACPANSDADKCLQVDFDSGSDLALLDDNDGCNYEGNFQNGAQARVFVSSQDCPIESDSTFYVSFSDARCPHMTFFRVDQGQFSTAEIIGENNLNDIEMIPPPDVLPPKNRTLLNREDMAGCYTLNLKIFYDNDFLDEFGADVESRIEAVMGHAQTIYNFGTLDAKMTFAVSSIEHYDGVTEATGEDLEILRDDFIPTDPDSPDLYVFFTYKNNEAGTVGIAWRGVVCLSDNNKGYRASINEYFLDDLTTAEIVAHEIGHNLNKQHDFDGSPGVSRFCDVGGEDCTNDGGVMDYFQDPVDKWTCCSNSDFANLFADNQPFCLTECAASCEDKKKTKKCEKLKKKGKCSKKRVAKKCAKTCEVC